MPGIRISLIYLSKGKQNAHKWHCYLTCLTVLWSPDGFYNIQPVDKAVSTYCDMTRNGGGWTLLLTSASRQGWNAQNILDRNGNKPSLTEDFSILGQADSILGKEKFQVLFFLELSSESKWISFIPLISLLARASNKIYDLIKLDHWIMQFKSFYWLSNNHYKYNKRTCNFLGRFYYNLFPYFFFACWI